MNNKEQNYYSILLTQFYRRTKVGDATNSVNHWGHNEAWGRNTVDSG